MNSSLSTIRTRFKDYLDENYRNLSENEIDKLLFSKTSQFTDSQIKDFHSTLGKIGGSIIYSSPSNISNIIQGGIAGVLGNKVVGNQPMPTPISSNTSVLPQPTSFSVTPSESSTPVVIEKQKSMDDIVASIQLMQLIQDPKFLQSISSLVLGSMGNESVKVMEEEIKIGDFLTTLEYLTNEAAMNSAEMYSTTSDNYTKSCENFSFILRKDLNV